MNRIDRIHLIPKFAIPQLMIADTRHLTPDTTQVTFESYQP